MNIMVMRIDVLGTVKYCDVPETFMHTNMNMGAGINAYKLDDLRLRAVHASRITIGGIEYVPLAPPWYTSQGSDAHSG